MTTAEKIAALVLISTDNEATAYPWWAICRSAGIMGDAVLAGPFFSRESAEKTRAAKIHRYGKKSYVFCFSGHESSDYIELRKLAKEATT